MKRDDNSVPRVLHVITSLDTGGAEMMLYKLLGQLGPFVQSSVVSLKSGGAIKEKIESLGIPVRALNIPQGGLPGPSASSALRSVTRSFQPTVVQGWMYHGNLAAWWARTRACSSARLIWNVRQTVYELKKEKLLTRWVIRCNRIHASSVEKIIYNSNVSAAQHEALGFPRTLRQVIPNGFDLSRFRPDPEAKASLRQEFGLAPDTRLVAHVARYHPMKDHATFLESVRLFLDQGQDACFLLVGEGVSALSDSVESMGLGDKIILCGQRDDIPRIMAAADLVVLSSAWGDAFPNIVGEAMACGTPCVVTDVGDSATIVGACGRVVPPRDRQAMAAALTELLEMDEASRLQMKGAARARVEELYSIERVAQTYLDIYRIGMEAG